MFTQEEAALIVKTLTPLFKHTALKPLEKAALKTVCAELQGDEFDKDRFMGSTKWLSGWRDKKQLTKDATQTCFSSENPDTSEEGTKQQE